MVDAVDVGEIRRIHNLTFCGKDTFVEGIAKVMRVIKLDCESQSSLCEVHFLEDDSNEIFERWVNWSE